MVNQIGILVWKNLLIRRNRYIATALEVLIPMVLLLMVNATLAYHFTVIDSDPIEFEAYKEADCSSKRSHYDSIIYEPSTPFTRLLMAKAACFAGYRKTSVKPGSVSDNKTYYSIGVRFDVANDTTLARVLNYTLFPTSKVFEKLGNLWRFYGTSVPKFTIPTIYSVVELQRAIDSSYLHLRNISTPKLHLENTDVYDRTPKVFNVVIFLTLLVAFSLMVPPIVSRIVEEKQTGAKELMLMMGVVRWQLWLAKFIDVIIFVTITVSGMVLLLCVPLRTDSSYVGISPAVLWAVLMYGFLGVILFLFCLSCLFDRPTQATFATEVIWSASFLLQYPIFAFVQLPTFVKFLYVCLFPHVSLMTGFTILLRFDEFGKELKLTEKLSGREDTLSLLDFLLTTTTGIVLYSILIWYFERVIPGKYGVPLPYDFFLKKSYWFPTKVINTCKLRDNADELWNNFEPVPGNLKPGVRIERVTKVYKSSDKGDVVAVNNACLDFYSCEISGLLGHNGAGKTTLFSMITGLSYPTSGKITVNGYDLGINIREARRSFGFCPQQDMLFNNLTAVQTLQFFGVVKGLTLKAAKMEANELIRKLQLTSVKNTPTSKLSGGQKRKVSLAIALIGGSQVLVLDEPTAGMDPEIRREIWEILLGFRSQRTILLTTHFMEEADALCDRIAIMDHGKIKCYGSPMFLKSKYGKGYILSVVVPDTDNSKEIIADYIKQFVTAKFTSQNIRTLRFQLPESEVSQFDVLFSGLDEKQAAGEITSYSISFSTLEDAFLGLRAGHEEFDVVDSPGYKKLDLEECADKEKHPKCDLIVSQFSALMIKKFIYLKRNYKSFLLYTVLTAILLVIMHFSLLNKTPRGGEVRSKGSLTYSLDLYPSSLVLYALPKRVTFEKTLLEALIKSSNSTAVEVADVKEAIYSMFREDFHKYARELMLAFNFTEDFRIYHNHNAVYGVPVALNFFHNYLLKYFYVDDGIVTSINATYSNKNAYVVPESDKECSSFQEMIPDVLGIQTMFYLLGPVRERFYGAKGLQLMLTPVSLYWFSHLLFDLFTYSFCVGSFLVGQGIGGNAILTKYPGEVFFGFCFWGAGLILIQYIISTLIKNPATAFSVNLLAYVVFSFSSYDVIEVGGPLSLLSYLHPSYFLKDGIKRLCSHEQSYFVLNLFLYCCVLFFVLVIKDSKFFSHTVHSLLTRVLKVNCYAQEEEDDLVKEEEAFVRKVIAKKNWPASGLLVNELRRWYWRRFRPSPAVRGISFVVNRGECFGLLGVNGAGKTTTFRMLTGEIPASGGSSYSRSERLSLWNRRRYLLSIGYCPQFGGVIPIFTGAELLEFFARLRGVPRSGVKGVVLKWISELGLLEYANKHCGTYSGGNQRKLSMAIALIGDAPLIFLDEPTTGVDPLSRRSIWKVIRDVQREERSVVLTSHSMDECEALCSRLAIMVKGRFRCIGETTTLKDRFGRGYSFQLKLSSRAAKGEVSDLKEFVAKIFQPGCQLVDDHVTLLQYHLTNREFTWERLFKKLNQLKKSFEIIESYTASATTLEQIFIYFARSAGETL